MVDFEDFKKLDIRIGKILSVKKIENSHNLLNLMVDFGDHKRQIVSGIAAWYKSEDLEGKKLPFLVNLKPRKFRGVKSWGMLLAVEGKERPILLEPGEGTALGDKVI